MNYSLEQLAEHLSGTLFGDPHITVNRLSPIDTISPGALVFVDGPENLQKAEVSEAAVLVMSTELRSTQKPYIQVSQPKQAFMKLLTYFHPPRMPPMGVHPSAILGQNVTIGEHVSIGPYVVIGDDCEIGDHCILYPHVVLGNDVSMGSHSVIRPQVTIYDGCKIGKNVNIHAGSIIGSDGFGYFFAEGAHQKVPHVGSVLIEDEVEIGANTVIDRATLGQTVIGTGTKIDNLVQIAHSVKIGKHNILCAFTGIAGSSRSGDYVVFAANVGVSDHVVIEDGVVLGARTGVPPNKHLKAGNVYLGNPARPKDKTLEQELATTRLPYMQKNIKTMSERLTVLEQKLKNDEGSVS
ncbi:MAG: UDP-3-O-(3-hydroxymyristoyl)glucosamine N-acyltransferase [Legionellaceae bacterium]|nr:UDP-3-O-(3-hydroxymyristoyl)glucosamine N-acyltransferase [Legionellaceae bacterium]